MPTHLAISDIDSLLRIIKHSLLVVKVPELRINQLFVPSNRRGSDRN